MASKFGQENTRQKFASIVDKCNQKCRDKGKIKEERNEDEVLASSFIGDCDED